MIIIDERKHFYKGNLHMHTTLSDGVLSPEEACAIYKAHGYDFVALTDHRYMGEQSFAEGFLVLSAGEYDFAFPTQQVHLVAIMPDNSLVGKFIPVEEPNAFIRYIVDHHGLVILAHPAWSLNTIEVMKGLSPLAAAEVFNSVSDTPWNGARADSSHVLDLLYTDGRLLPQVASDDTHWYDGEECRSFTMVQADSLNPNAIVEAIRNGQFYASQGPLFRSVELLEDRIVVKTSPVEQILFNSNLVYVKNRCRQGHDMVSSEYVFSGHVNEHFVRCEIMDAQGRRAWLSPIPV